MERLDGASFSETNEDEWKVKFHPCAKNSLQVI